MGPDEPPAGADPQGAGQHSRSVRRPHNCRFAVEHRQQPSDSPDCKSAIPGSNPGGSLIDLLPERYGHGTDCTNHRRVVAHCWAGGRIWACSLWAWAIFRVHHPHPLACLCRRDHRSRRRSRPRNRDCSAQRTFKLSKPTTRKQNAALAASNGKKHGQEQKQKEIAAEPGAAPDRGRMRAFCDDVLFRCGPGR